MRKTERPWRGALTTAEAAKETNRTPQAISHAIRTGALKATRSGNAPRSPYWIDILDLWDTYPLEIRPDPSDDGKKVYRANHWQNRMRNGWTVTDIDHEPNPEADAEARTWRDAAVAAQKALDATK